MTKPQQGTLAKSEFEAYRTVTRRERFLAEMERLVPWGEVCELIEPVYSNPEGPGRRPYPGITIEGSPLCTSCAWQ
jgi:IS5 family transposase